MENEILAEFVAGRQNRMDGAALRVIRTALDISTCTLASRIGSTEVDLERLEKKRHIPIPIEIDRKVRELFLSSTLIPLAYVTQRAYMMGHEQEGPHDHAVLSPVS